MPPPATVKPAAAAAPVSTAVSESDPVPPVSGPGAVRLSPVSKYGRVRRARSDAAYVSTDRTYAALSGQDLAPARLQEPTLSGARRRAAELRRSLADPTDTADMAATAAAAAGPSQDAGS